MFGFGFGEIIFLAILALIVIGPEDLPKLARNIGRLINEIKRGSDSFKSEIMSHQNDIRRQIHESTKVDLKLNEIKANVTKIDEIKKLPSGESKE